MKRHLVYLAVLAAALAGPAGAGTQGAAVSVHRLNVQVGEWAMIPSAGRVPAGRVRVVVQNFGQLRHELDIVPTERWGQKLAVHNGRAVGEDAAPPIVVAPGQTRSAEVNLARGFYVLVDNLRGHYAAGAAVAIVVG
jgi:uncharacterized cupredoxin-like copper-binding protein